MGKRAVGNRSLGRETKGRVHLWTVEKAVKEKPTHLDLVTIGEKTLEKEDQIVF